LSAEAKKPRVMIADDEIHTRVFLKAILQGMKCEVVAEASNGAEVLEIYRNTRPHLLLLDVSMPFKTGDEALQEIMNEFPKAFVIMLTSVADVQTIEKCLQIGASNYIRKDTSVDEIRAIIKESWQLRRSL
jgi:two-component system, chemotaxis family, chemotaxis protein CheY